MTVPKPLLRGVSHQLAFFAALLGTAGLLAVAGSSALPTRSLNVWGVLVYGLSLCGLFGTSALFHRRTWTLPAFTWIQRLDHAAIFTLIAGTFTPLALQLGPAAPSALTVSWGGALLGVCQSFFWVSAPRAVAAALAVVVGWSMFPYLLDLRPQLGWSGVGLVAGGGVLYSVGAWVYARKYPDPLPKVFGYHEVFHALTIGAAVCHYVAIVRVVRGE